MPVRQFCAGTGARGGTMRRTIQLGGLGAACLAIVHAARAGPTWCEVVNGHGDAGNLILTSQKTLGMGRLSAIEGMLEGGADFEDVFEIRIVDAPNFSAQTIFNIPD